ncbi:hypothetical protein J1614_003783 [Plenodomus biglobosus]|nr:hypothetical protein J1614_003783 [Plenodomus biglobosus]
MTDGTPTTPPPQCQPTTKAHEEDPSIPTATSRTDTMSPARTPYPDPLTPRRSIPDAATDTSSSRRRVPPSTTNTTSTPFPPRTPRTPASGTGQVCTTDATLFRCVSIHTAKCTECDKRNKAIMRRCPGCTFQVCTPCFEKREKEGRGLRHGIAMSGSASPATERMVRTRPFGSSGGGQTQKIGGPRDEGIAGGEGKGKRKIKQEGLPKKRAARKKKTPRFVDSEDEEDDELSSEGYEPEEGTPTPSKRRRSVLTMDGPSFASPRQIVRKPPTASSNSTYQFPSSLVPEDASDAPASTGGPRSEHGIDELMRSFGVNTAENPYHEHPLSRRMPVVANPAIKIPSKMMRKFEPRPAGVTQKNIQEQVLHKMQEQEKSRSASATEQEDGVSHLKDGRMNAPATVTACTVRTVVEKVAAKYRDDATMDEDECKALIGHLEAEALSWGTIAFRRLTPHEQGLMRPGLNMRLDLLSDPKAVVAELEGLLIEQAVTRLRRMDNDRAG